MRVLGVGSGHTIEDAENKAVADAIENLAARERQFDRLVEIKVQPSGMIYAAEALVEGA